MRKIGYRAEIDSDKKMHVVTINVPAKMLIAIERFIKWGLNPSRSEYIRAALKDKIEKDIKLLCTIDSIIHNETEPNTIRVPKENGEFQTYKVLRRLE